MHHKLPIRSTKSIHALFIILLALFISACSDDKVESEVNADGTEVSEAEQSDQNAQLDTDVESAEATPKKEPEVVKVIDFSNPYVNIDANFIYRNNNNFISNEDVDSFGIKIAVVERSAYDLWLTENFHRAELVRVNTIENSHQLFREKKVDVLAGLRPKLIDELKNDRALKLISNPFTYIKQSIGIKKGNPEVLNFLNKFILKIIKDGYVESLLKKHKVLNKLSIPKDY